MDTKVGATIVYEQNWDAIHEIIPGEFNPDGSPLSRYDYLLNTGSSRSSKTRSFIQIFWNLAWELPGKRLAVFRDTKTLCKDTVGNDMQKTYPNMPGYHAVWFNKTNSYWHFPNGSVIEIRGTDDPEVAHGYNCDILWLNEPYNISEFTFDQLDQRCSMFVLLDLNPKQLHWSDNLPKDKRTKVIHSTFRDNPFCPPKEKRKLLGYQPISMFSAVMEKIMSEAEAKEYSIIENPLNLTPKQINELSRCRENERKGTAKKFDWIVYGLGLKADRPTRIFHWEEISDDAYHAIQAEKYWGSDWGKVDPWAVGEGKYQDGCLYVHEINYLSENQIRDEMSPIDREAISEAEEGLIPFMFKKWGIPQNGYIICDNSRPLKVLMLRQNGYDYAIGQDKPQGSIIDGIATIEELKVFYTKSSVNIAIEQENYSRKVDRYGIKMEEPEDGQQDHHCDWIRYLVLFLRRQGIIKVG